MDFVEDTSGILTPKIKPNFRTLGKVYGARMKEIAQGFATLDQATIAAIQAAGDYTLNLPGGEVKLTAEDYQISSEDMPGWIVASEGALTVALDVALTPELVQEGIAREVVSRIQNLRKESGFEVTDRIDTVLYSDSEQLAAAMAAFGKYVAAQTLSRTLEIKPLAQAPAQAAEQEWADGALKIIVKR